MKAIWIWMMMMIWHLEMMRVAIAGVYMLGEEIDRQHLGKLTQVTLDDELVLESMD